jgi:hypothetical protein
MKAVRMNAVKKVSLFTRNWVDMTYHTLHSLSSLCTCYNSAYEANFAMLEFKTAQVVTYDIYNYFCVKVPKYT